MDKCEDIVKGPSTTDIYQWQKLTIPGNMVDVKFLVASKDNNYLYLHTDDASNGGAGAGLYWSDDKGKTWHIFESAPGANDGELRGIVAPGATMTAIMQTNLTIPTDIKPTRTGIALLGPSTGSATMFLIAGPRVIWAIDRTVHNNAAAPNNQVVNFSDLYNITFIDVVDINNHEVLVFGQKYDASTEYMIWLQSTSSNTKPLGVQIIKVGGLGPLTDSQSFVRAGNTFDKDLLLAACGGGSCKTNAGTGLWHIAKTSLPNFDAAGVPTLSASNGQVLDDDPVLFPEDSTTAGAKWLGDNADNNVSILTIGSLNNGGNHFYYAGLKENTSVMANAIGGLAYFAGSQSTAASHANHMSLLYYTSAYGIKDVMGTIRVLTDHGIRGFNRNNDFLISGFSRSRHEMIDDGSGNNIAVPFNPSHDTCLKNVYGDDDTSFYFVKCATASLEDGLYIREKKQGQVRP